MTYILSFYFSMLLTTALIPPFMKLGTMAGMVDVPDARKVHTKNIPRTGGIAVVLGAVIPFLLLLKATPGIALGIGVGGMIILLEGLIDDMRGLSHRAKFAAQAGAALAALLFSGIRLHSLGELWPGCFVACTPIALPVSVFFLLSVINSINLADGLDGLAGGISLLIFTSTGLLAFLGGGFQTLSISVCMAGAIIGFLRYNSHPAVVFLGDTGSQFLGFMIGFVMILATQSSNIFSPVLGLYLLGIPVLDTLFVMIERGIEHRPLFHADKNHLHHKLLKMGLTHPQAVGAIYITQICIVLLGWSLRRHSDSVMFGVYLLVMLGFLSVLLIHRWWYHAQAEAEQDPHNVGFHLLPDRPRPKVALTRRWLSRVSWAAMFGAVLVFYVASPVLIRPVDKIWGILSLVFAVSLVTIKFLKPGILNDCTKLAACFIGTFYIFVEELGDPGMLWEYERFWIYWIIFGVMGISYCCYLVTTSEKMPIVTMDYLLLGIVSFTFFLPQSLLAEYHVNRIAAKMLLIFLCFELLTFRMKRGGELEMGGVLVSLCLNALMAFSPWLI